MVRSGVALGAVLAVLLAAPAAAQDRYALAGGCYALTASGSQVAKTAGGGYRTTAGAGERLRLQATAAGSAGSVRRSPGRRVRCLSPPGYD